ncbi:calcium-binding protein [Gemmobacter denitrificans]|uniref:Calcium-binding protein n=1 Tax=Gemmobacter denitrificans TaxID=3123040 RepID=A0ABU8BW91_9RHOB
MTVDIYAPTANDTLSAEEMTLYRLIMDYRAENGLAAIPLSDALTITAGRHATDTVANIWQPRLDLPDGANLHSWSDAPYFSDHRQPEIMWHAPERLGTGFEGFGFEISTELGGVTTPSAALASWKGSPGHDAVIRNTGVWADFSWTAIGVGIDRLANGRTIMHVWFSDTPDANPARQLGTASSNAMSGTDFADHLLALGGHDTLNGLRGDDLLFGGAGRDRINAGAGNDQLDGGKANDILSGGQGRDTLSGGAGSDRLDGGAGRDDLTGGAGADSFILRAAEGDRIGDFGATDRLVLDGRPFLVLGKAISAAEFHVGAAAETADQHLIYDRDTGRLWFDRDGNGAAAAQLLAQLQGLPELDRGDLVLS